MHTRLVVTKRLHPATCILAMLLVFSSTFVSEALAATLPGSNVREIPVSKTQKYYGCSSRRYVIWIEKAGLRGYDLSAREAFSIPTNKRPTGRPQMSGTKLIWSEDGGTSGRDIVGYDLAKETYFDVTREPGDQGNFNIDGNVVVWADPNESETADIYAKDLATGEKFVVSTESGQQSNPDVSGDWVVYDTDASGDRDVKAYNIRTQERKTLCGWNGDQYHPRIGDSGFVVWQDAGTVDPDQMNLRGRYIDGGDIRTIASGRGAQHAPSIDGSLICYMDDQYPGGYGLLGYDLLSNTRFGVASARGDYVQEGGINDGTIAWFATEYESLPYSTRVYLARPVELDVVPLSPARMAVAESRSAFKTGASTVVITSKSSWQDAGVASAVAGLKAPFLMTSGTSLSSSVSKELRRLNPSSVVIVGPTTAVSSSVASQIRAALPNATVERIGGTSAKSTSFRALPRVSKRAGWNGTVLICSPKKRAGAVVAAPVAARKGYPIVYVGSSGLTSRNLKSLKAAGARRFVIVGSGVPSSVDAKLKSRFGSSSTKRIVGETSAATSVKFAKWAVRSANMRWSRIGISSKSSGTRSIAAGTATGRDRGVILLTSGTSLSSPTAAVLKEKDPSLRKAHFVGGKTVVTKDVRRQVRRLVR